MRFGDVIQEFWKLFFLHERLSGRAARSTRNQNLTAHGFWLSRSFRLVVQKKGKKVVGLIHN